jgi:threonine dehydrogenase-like Zn-dependent dehydrogenase
VVAVDRVRELTAGGAAPVVAAVGAASSFATANDAPRPGGTVGHVGVPVHPVNLGRVHLQNIRLLGGVAPVRGYMENLMADILAGKLDPSPVLDTVLPLEEVPEGYAAMDERRALKVLVRTGAA